MAEGLIFHHVLGLTGGVEAFANAIAAATLTTRRSSETNGSSTETSSPSYLRCSA